MNVAYSSDQCLYIHTHITINIKIIIYEVRSNLKGLLKESTFIVNVHKRN